MPSGVERILVQITERFKSYTPVFVHLYQGDFLRTELESKNIKVHCLSFKPIAGFFIFFLFDYNRTIKLHLGYQNN